MPEVNTEVVQDNKTEPTTTNSNSGVQNENVVKDDNSTKPKQDVDIVKRVSQFKPAETQPANDGDKFNVNQLDSTIEAIQDPAVKEQILLLKKSLIAGENQKYQDIATLRKNLEAEKGELSNWTTEKVQGLLNDPAFIKAAQSVSGTSQQGADQNDSMLSDVEKQQIGGLQNQINTIVSQNTQLLKQQQDEGNKGKYANYNSQAVDILTNELLQGKVQANRESLWKVLDYEPAVRRAYQLGLEDKKLETNEKVNANSIDGLNIVKTDNAPAPEKGESNINYFKRLVIGNIKKSNESVQIRK